VDAHEPASTPPGQSLRVLFHFLETKSMFKKLVPVIALALIAGPVFAADAPASTPSSDQSSSSTTTKSHHKKHHSKKSTSKSDSSKSSDSAASAPAK
jgi:hypothetical protein